MDEDFPEIIDRSNTRLVICVSGKWENTQLMKFVNEGFRDFGQWKIDERVCAVPCNMRRGYVHKTLIRITGDK
jgi:hypothetical protein